MPIANTGRSALGRRFLGSFAIALGCRVGEAAPAGADPTPVGTDPNPFGTLSCSCRETAPAAGADPREEIARGIRERLSAWLPGSPAPGQPLQPPR